MIIGAKKQKGGQQKPNIQKDTTASNEFVQALYGLAEGEIAGLVDGGKSIKLDGTPLINDDGQPNFDNVAWDFRVGTLNQDYIKGFGSVSNETNVNVELRHDKPFVKALNNTALDALVIRLGFNALYEQKDNGDIVGNRIEYAIDVQTDGGAWSEMLSTFIHDKASQGYKRSHRIELPKARRGWVVRVRRITPNRDSGSIGDTMSVVAITEVIDAKLRYPNTALLALKYDAEIFSNIAKLSVRLRGKLIQVPSNYNPTERTYNGMWDGAFKLEYSNNPAWVYYDICTHKRYGLGLSVDKWQLYQIAQYCDEMVDDGKGGKEPRFTCNVYLQKAEDAYQVLQSLASVFRGLTYWDGTQIVVDSDTPKDAVYTFTRSNVVNGEFIYTGTRHRDRHTVFKVAFDSPDNDYKTEYEMVRDDYAIAKYGINILDINAFGCTSQAQAQRVGQWALKTEQLETQSIAFKTGLDGFIPKVGDVINVADDVRAGRAVGGRIVAANGKTVTLDKTPVGNKIVINGDVLKVVNITGNTVTLDKAIDAKAEQIWAMQADDLYLSQYRIISLSYDDATFSVIAVEYRPEKYSDAVRIIPRPVSIIKPSVLPAPNSVMITAHSRTHQGVSLTTLSINWEQVVGAVAYVVEWRKDDNAWQTVRVASQSLDIDGVYAGNYIARVAAIDAFDNQSLATSSVLTQIQGKQGKPPRLASLNVQGILFGMNLGWNFAKGSGDTNYTEIEVSPDGRSNITTLGTFAYPTNKHEITGLQGNLTQFYRARIVDKLGNTSDWTDWVSGTTSADADKVLDILSGQISQSHLDQSLRTPIGKIGTLESNISGINSKIPTLESNISGINSKIPAIESNISSISSRADTINSTLTDANNRLNEAVQSITSIDTRTQWQTRGATSLNSLIEQGKYYLESSFNTNTPLSGWQYATVDKARNGDRITQTVWNDSTKTYTRTKTGDTWSEWVESVDKSQLDSTANQLSQSIEQTSTQIRSELGTKANIDSVTGAIRDINALQADKNAKTQEIANLTQTVNGHTSQVRELGVTTGDLSQKYSQVKTQANNATSEITAIKQTQNGQAASVERLRSEMAGKASSADLQSVQQTLTTADSSLSQRIDTLQSDYNGNKASVQSSINTLTDANRTQAERLERLTTRFDGVLGGQNLLSDTTTKTGTQFLLGEYPINRTLQEGQRVIVKATTTPAQQVLVYNSSPRGANRIGEITADGTPHEFTWAVGDGGNNSLHIYRTNINNRSSVTLDAVSLAVPDGALADVTANLAEFKQATADKDQATASRITSIDTAYKQADSTLTTQIASEITARTDADNSLASRINTLQSDYNGNKASVAGQLKTLSDKDNATASQISRLNSQMADKASTASVNSLTESLASKEQALSRRINTVESSVSGNTSSINTLNQSLTDKERALTEQITTAKSELGGRITQISDETRTLSDANRTIGERINRLDSELAGEDTVSDNLLIDGDRAKVNGDYLIATYRISETLKNGDKVRLTVIANIGINRTGFMAYNSNSAGASKLADITRSQNGAYTAEFEWNVGTGGNNELWLYHDSSNTRSISSIYGITLQKITTGSALASIKSSVASLERTVTTSNQSLSERINTVQTTVNGQAASIQQHAQSLNGLSAQWTLKVQSGGVVSGIGLASNNGVSDFAVRADKFYVASPQGDKKPMFSVITRPTTLNGTTVPTGVYLNGDLIASGTISGDKIRANTQITAPNIRGGSINIGSNFSVDNQGNLNANSGVFRGQVFADKITGQIDVESLKSSAVALGYDMYISSSYHSSDPSHFDKIFKASYASYGSIIQSLGFNNENIGSVLYEMSVFCKRAITVKQKLHTVDDNLYCYVNGDSAFGYHSNYDYYDNEERVPTPFGRGRINTEISLSLRQGLNTIQFVLNNSGGGICHLIVLGDFIDNNIIKFA
ncbi:TipJ family phage tail tip protein [Moraxella catarrhalis]|uniref:TipJ family phage tail tip protein n=1 Tax=Moraxella catarrhalis TaxID=480 RepID=UPI0007E4ACB9|nr:phage tail protein [Moraxella catarrhalis]OAV29463.1 Phage tail fiber protein [Moraxella catarrhalis]